MLQFDQLLDLAKAVAKADPSAPIAYSFNGENLTYNAMNDTLRAELNELCGSYASYRENKNTIFALIEQTLSEVLPKRVLEQYGQFAEVKTFGQGEKPVFVQKLGRRRAKQFITRVGLAGIYEVFKLGSKAIEVPTSAIGGAAQIGLEEFLDGRVDFSELVQIVMDGMDELIYREIAKAMVGAIGDLPAANVVNTNAWNETSFDNLLAAATAYGRPTIYCPFQFAATMMPASTQWSESMKNDKWNNGYFTNYKGFPVIVLPQSFEDENNTTKVIDPAYCWIIASENGEKPVKIAFEGDTIVDEFKNYDRSREIQVYKKVGVAVVMTSNIFSYRNSTLA